MSNQSSFLLHAGERHSLGGTRGKTLAAFKPLAQPAKLGQIGAHGRIGSGESALDVGYSSLSPEQNIEPEAILPHQSPDVAQVQTSGAESPGGGSATTGTSEGGSGTGGGSGDGGTGSGAGSTDGSTGVAGPGNGSADGSAF